MKMQSYLFRHMNQMYKMGEIWYGSNTCENELGTVVSHKLNMKLEVWSG